MERIGYKKGILTGLLLCATGAVLFLPASSSRVYGFFLLALFVMACGQSFLEVASNPYVTILGPAASAERRLNFAQSFNAVGAVLSPIIGRTFILTSAEYAPAQIAAMSTDATGQLSRRRGQHGEGSLLDDRGNLHRDRRADSIHAPAGSTGGRDPSGSRGIKAAGPGASRRTGISCEV